MKILLCSHVRACLGIVALAATSLLWAEPPPASAVMVEVIPCQASSQRARITIDLNGKSAKDVRLILTTLENQPVQALSIDEFGIAVLPPLTPGKYLVSASAPENLGAALCVEISKKKWKQVSSFSLALKTLPPAPPTREELLSAAEDKPPRERIQQFRGVVVDPSGAAVSGIVIQIFPKGARDDARTAKATSDASGHFSVALPDGVYTAFLMSPGFRTEIVTFEITHAGTANGLRISLQIGMIT
jgi:hypothetical protein